jgi:hypothetical protein
MIAPCDPHFGVHLARAIVGLAADVTADGSRSAGTSAFCFTA